MARSDDAFKGLAAAVFVVGGVAELFFSALFALYLSWLSIPSAVFGAVCLWVARGLMRADRAAWWVGIVISILSLFPMDLISSDLPLPGLAVWAVSITNSYATGWVVSAAIGVAMLAYLFARHTTFERRGLVTESN